MLIKAEMEFIEENFTKNPIRKVFLGKLKANYLWNRVRNEKVRRRRNSIKFFAQHCEIQRKSFRLKNFSLMDSTDTRHSVTAIVRSFSQKFSSSEQ